MKKQHVQSVTVEYDDGSVSVFSEEGMYHIVRTDYPRGATKVEEGYDTHQIRWETKGK